MNKKEECRNQLLDLRMKLALLGPKGNEDLRNNLMIEINKVRKEYAIYYVEEKREENKRR